MHDIVDTAARATLSRYAPGFKQGSANVRTAISTKHKLFQIAHKSLARFTGYVCWLSSKMSWDIKTEVIILFSVGYSQAKYTWTNQSVSVGYRLIQTKLFTYTNMPLNK